MVLSSVRLRLTDTDEIQTMSMDRKYLKVENVQHYLYQNYFYVCLHLLEPEINRWHGFLGFLHLHCTTST